MNKRTHTHTHTYTHAHVNSHKCKHMQCLPSPHTNSIDMRPSALKTRASVTHHWSDVLPPCHRVTTLRITWTSTRTDHIWSLYAADGKHKRICRCTHRQTHRHAAHTCGASVQAGLSREDGAGLFKSVIFVLQWPFSVLRWLSIAPGVNSPRTNNDDSTSPVNAPMASQVRRWDRKRRLFASVSPVGSVGRHKNDTKTTKGIPPQQPPPPPPPPPTQPQPPPPLLHHQHHYHPHDR
jgi:hypothetical protein